MRIRYALACTLLLALTSCSYFDFDCFCDDDCSCNYSQGGYEVPEAPMVDLPPPVLSIHSQEVTNIIQQVSVEFRHNKQHLNLEDARTFYNEEGIHTIQLTYSTQTLADVCDARALIVDLVQSLLDNLNSNQYLLPEFPNFAFYPFNFEIMITFQSFYARYIDPYYIRYICMNDGEIAYYSADLLDNDKSCWHVRRESFYTSRDIVFFQRTAEEEYKLLHGPDMSVFGNKRWFPPQDEDH